MTVKLLDTNPILVFPELAAEIGLNESIFLQQIHYWAIHNKKTGQNFKDGFTWVYGSIRYWSEKFLFWSPATLKRITKNLEESGLLVSGRYNKMKMDRTKWYRIDYIRFQQIISKIPLVQNDLMHEGKVTQPIPETNIPTRKNRKMSVDEYWDMCDEHDWMTRKRLEQEHQAGASI